MEGWNDQPKEKIQEQIAMIRRRVAMMLMINLENATLWRKTDL